MQYKEFQPTPALAKYLDCFWVMESTTKQNLLQPQRILPDGCIEMLFHFRSRNKRITGNDIVLEPTGFINGQLKSHILIKPSGDIGVFGIRFKPLGAFPFLRLPLAEITDKTIDVDAMFGIAGMNLQSRILASKTHEEKIAHTEEFLLNCVDETFQQDFLVRHAVAAIIHSYGQMTMYALMKKLNISSKLLERKFNRFVGISPKRFARIIRFQKIHAAINKNSYLSLTTLAHDFGYYDQAHFIKDFKAFTGKNPTAHFSQAQSMTEFFTSAKRMSNFYNPD